MNTVCRVIIKAAQTGEIGDGKIFIHPVADVMCALRPAPRKLFRAPDTALRCAMAGVLLACAQSLLLRACAERHVISLRLPPAHAHLGSPKARQAGTLALQG